MEALILKSFGYGVGQYINPYRKIPETIKDKVLYKSKLGTPVFCNLEIQAGSWTDSKGVVHEWPYLVFDTVLMTVDQPKTIVKTKVQNRKGTVKEYISDDDYAINIKLIIIGENGVMPLQEISDLKKALDAPVPLAVNSRWLQNLGIDNIVIESASWPQVEGGYNMQGVEIRASSDEPIELIIQ